MKIISLKCNSCGSDLQIDETTKYFNCSFCGSSLAIQRTGNAVYTKVLDEIKGNTESIKDTTEKLLIEKQIARLDRDWEKEEEELDAILANTTKSSPIGGIILIMAGSGFSFGINNFRHAPEFFVAIPYAIIVIGVISMIYGFAKQNEYSNRKKNYDSKEKAYLSKRASLLQKIEYLDD